MKLASKIIKKDPKKADGRKTVAVVFILTILASSLVYLQTKLPAFWQKLFAPTIISTVPEEKQFNPAPALEAISALTKDLRGTYGVYVYRLDDYEEYGVHQDEVFPAASLMKLPVILTVYQQAEAGYLDLEAKYILQAADKIGGAGLLQTKPAGEKFSYRQLLEYMGQYSDNTANHVLVKTLTSQKIQQTIDDLGMAKTSLADYETSPEDMGLFFRLLYQGKLVSKDSQKEIFSFLTDTAFEDRIPAGVPEGVRVIHKIGTEIGNFADAAIVMAEKPFVLVIISKNAREAEALEVLPKIAAAVWEFEAGN